MGELQHEPFQFAFNGFLKVAFHGSRVTSDAGLILVRELDERLGLETLIAEHLSDSRQGLNTQFSLADLLRQSVYSRLAGYEDLNDAVRVSADPTFRLIGSPKMWDRGAALTSTLHWFETELLTQETNFVGLRAVNRAVLAQAEMVTRADRILLDMDSSESPVLSRCTQSGEEPLFHNQILDPPRLRHSAGRPGGSGVLPGGPVGGGVGGGFVDRARARGRRRTFLRRLGLRPLRSQP